MVNTDSSRLISIYRQGERIGLQLSEGWSDRCATSMLRCRGGVFCQMACNLM